MTAPVVLLGLSATAPAVGGANIAEPTWSSYTRSLQDLSTWNNISGNIYTNINPVVFPLANIPANTYFYMPYFFIKDNGSLTFQGAGSINPGANLGQNATLSFGTGSITFTYGTINYTPQTTNNAFPTILYPAFTPTFLPFALGEPIQYLRNMRS